MELRTTDSTMTNQKIFASKNSDKIKYSKTVFCHNLKINRSGARRLNDYKRYKRLFLYTKKYLWPFTLMP